MKMKQSYSQSEMRSKKNCEAITHKTLLCVSDMQEAKAGKTKTAGE